MIRTNYAISIKRSNTESLDALEVFKGNSDIVFVIKRVERLSSAIHLVTSFLGNLEPIRHDLRDISLKLVIDLIGMGSKNNVDISALDNVSYDLAKCQSLLEIATISGSISPMNHGILRSEIQQIVKSLDKIRRNPSSDGGSNLSPAIFDVSGVSLALSRDYTRSRITSKVAKTVSLTQQQGKFQGQSKGHILSKDVSLGRSIISQNDSKSVLLSREDIILNLLKSGNSMTVKEFSNIIKDCSEKTIQRILIRFVKSGVLKKEGLRRWSRYSMSKMSHRTIDILPDDSNSAPAVSDDSPSPSPSPSTGNLSAGDLAKIQREI